MSQALFYNEKSILIQFVYNLTYLQVVYFFLLF